jgi:hypothetical protein
MLIRRVVPAIVATLVVYTGLAFAAAGFLRQHYLTPLLTSNLNVPGSAWMLSQWWTKGGTTISQSTMDQIQSSLAQQIMPVVPESVRKVNKGQTITNVLQIPHPARIHAMDEVSARQPVLALPVDRGRLAARAVSAAHRRDRLAGPPPGDLNRLPAPAPDDSNPVKAGRRSRLRAGQPGTSSPPVTLASPAHVSRVPCAGPGKTPRKSAPFAGNVGADHDPYEPGR